ncbi:Rid family hydrolase [Streptomyces sp. AD681]|uniref:RidA family protein n=1 Tax=Streptomyces sp. AD681 TaxID=3019069 RepID=UPI0022F18487|nr:Rid family hydrolase [Streptomyces sp. AD681]MDA5147312.1 Rid family hydrolase [Streptomyces sp. AD681]
MIHRIEPDRVFGVPDLISRVSVPSGRDLAFLSGQVARDEEVRVVGKGDHVAQVMQTVRRIDRAHGGLGAGRQDTVKETVHVVDYEPRPTPAVLGALHGSLPPLPTLVGAARLSAPEFLSEVECVIALPSPAEGLAG